MERSLRLERLYPLAQYANIKFADEITGLPEETIFNVALESKLRYLQMLQAEIAYRDYVTLMGKAETLSVEEVAKFLEEERVKTLQDIVAEFANKK